MLTMLVHVAWTVEWTIKPATGKVVDQFMCLYEQSTAQPLIHAHLVYSKSENKSLYSEMCTVINETVAADFFSSLLINIWTFVT